MTSFGWVEGISPSSNPYQELDTAPGGTFADLTVGARLAGGVENITKSAYEWVRRPMRGIQLKEETFATISVKDSEGFRRSIINESYQENEWGEISQGNLPYAQRTSNFILQSVQESRAEKTQIVQTFDNSYIFFYGEQPRTLALQGVLMNTEDFDWRAEWWANYNKYFRGTALVRMNSILELTWDDITVKGYILDSTCTEQTDAPYNVNLGFTLFVTSYVNRKDNNFSEDFPVPTTGLINPLALDTPGAVLTQTAAGKVRSLALSNYLKGKVSAARAIAAVRSDFGGSGISAWGLNAGNFLQDVKQFMFGRPLRVPPGAAGSELIAGIDQAVFAAGTGFADSSTLNALFTQSQPQLRQAIREKLSTNTHTSPTNTSFDSRSKFRDNFDEFPRAGVVYYDGKRLDEQGVARRMTELQQQAAAKGLNLLVTEEEASHFDFVTDVTLREFGLDPTAGYSITEVFWGRAALGAFNIVGTSLLSYDVSKPRTWGDSARIGGSRVGRGVRVGGF